MSEGWCGAGNDRRKARVGERLGRLGNVVVDAGGKGLRCRVCRCGRVCGCWVGVVGCVGVGLVW